MCDSPKGKITTESDFIEVLITPEMLKEAEIRNAEFQKKYGNKGTHRTNKQNQRMTGYLAEIAIKHMFPKLEYSLDDNVDFTSRNKKISFDSKSQGCNSKPCIDFVATLYEEQAKRDVDVYIFNRVKNDFKKVWIAGIIGKTEFLKIAKLQKKGTKNNNFTYDNSRYELEYSELYNAKLLT